MINSSRLAEALALLADEFERSALALADGPSFGALTSTV